MIFLFEIDSLRENKKTMQTSNQNNYGSNINCLTQQLSHLTTSSQMAPPQVEINQGLRLQQQNQHGGFQQVTQHPHLLQQQQQRYPIYQELLQ